MTSWTHQRTEDEPAEGHLGCFQVLATMNKAAVYISVSVLCEHSFKFFCINSQVYNCWLV